MSKTASTDQPVNFQLGDQLANRDFSTIGGIPTLWVVAFAIIVAFVVGGYVMSRGRR